MVTVLSALPSARRERRKLARSDSRLDMDANVIMPACYVRLAGALPIGANRQFKASSEAILRSCWTGEDWLGNVKKSGFLPSERQWLTELMATGWVDVVRKLHPDVAGPYSWWSWRGRAFDNDAGWRIDYPLAPPAMAGRARAARVERAAAYALRWSDHAPVTVEYR